MRRPDLEHIIRAAADISADDEIIIIGSQSILGQYPDAPGELCVSMEADVYPMNYPERADVIDGAIGELSPFHETFGYYAQGVGENTATLPVDWQARLVPICNANTRGATGYCLEVHDLLISKYVAGRGKDRYFVRGALQHGLAVLSVLLERLQQTTLDSTQRTQLEQLIRRDHEEVVRP